MQRQTTKCEDVLTETPLRNSAVTPVDVLMIGTGEYTTGCVNGKASDSDKGAGVVALTLFDLRSRGVTGRLGLCGVNGTKFPTIRHHMYRAIEQVYRGLNTVVETFPSDSVIDPSAYKAALSLYKKGDAVIIFTPDDTHFEIALAAVRAGMHVLVTKPAVKTLSEHEILCAAARENNVLVAVEVHKRWDPIYTDARDRMQNLGAFSHLYSYMSQPKHQLETFRSWAGKSSDISYYLNSHHIDFHEWVVADNARPVKVTAMASTGVARDRFGVDCEDTITLAVEWENLERVVTASQEDERAADVLLSSTAPTTTIRDERVRHRHIRVVSKGTAIYTSSWVAPKSDVHSQQRFFYMGQVSVWRGGG